MARKPEAAELERAFPLNEFLNLPPEYDEFLNLLTTQIHEQQGFRNRRDTNEKTKTALGVILANLINARSTARDTVQEVEGGEQEQLTIGGWLSISLNNNSYVNSRYNNGLLSYRAVMRALDFLRDQENAIPLVVEERRGFQDEGTGVSRNTRLRLKTSSYELFLFREEGKEPLNPTLRAIPLTTNSTFRYPVSRLVHTPQSEIIRLKNADKVLVDYEDTEEVVEMRERLRVWNEFALTKWPDVFLTNDEFLALQGQAVDADVEEAFRSAGESHTRPIDLTHRWMYRVFNNGLWRHGGRLYGGWWQYVPSGLRNRITINTRPTVEIDFSNMQAAMIYARERLELPGDAYNLDGIDPSYRKLIKSTFFQMINARPRQRLRAPAANKLPPDVTFDDLRTLIAEKHAPIAGYLNTGIGIELQKIDAEIALDVMLSAMEDDELVLPIHDSFIGKSTYADNLQNNMLRCYRERFEQNINVDDVQPYQQVITLQAPAGEHYHEVEVDVDDLIEQDDYSGYRDRHPQFAN